MPGVVRVNQDSCVGRIIDPKANTVFVNNAPISVKGANVQPHGLPPHSSPKTDQSSPNVSAYNIPINRQGDLCSCGHPISSGSGNVLAN